MAFNLKTNEVSQVVTTDFGYHIIQTLEHEVQPFDEVQGRIAAMLKAKQSMAAAEPMIKGLKEKAKINYLNGATPPAPAPAMFPGAMPADDGQPADVPETKAVDQPAAPQPAKVPAAKPAQAGDQPAEKAKADAPAKPVDK